MSKSVTCDNCEKAVAERPDNTIGWVKVGWRDAGQDDACSIDCARALLDQMQQAEWEFEQEESVRRAEVDA